MTTTEAKPDLQTRFAFYATLAWITKPTSHWETNFYDSALADPIPAQPSKTDNP